MSLKNKIKSAVKAEEMIEKCAICRDRKRKLRLGTEVLSLPTKVSRWSGFLLSSQIVAHHPTETNPATALIHILKCNQCRPILFAIRQCAQEGHIITEENP